MLATMRTHFNILQEDQIWTSGRNVIIVIGLEGTLLCEWPEPVPVHWEMSGADTSTENTPGNDSSCDKDVPDPVCQLVKTLGGCPHVRML